MGFDAVGLSSNDLTAGKPFFTSQLQLQFPWISANVYDTDGKLAFSPYIITPKGSLSVGIIGLTDTTNKVLADYIVGDWETALKEQITTVENQCDLLILLSTLSIDTNKRICERYPQIDLIITADRRRGNMPPFLHKSTLLTQGTSRGKYLSQLDIEFSPKGVWPDKRGSSVDYFQKKLVDIDKQVKRITARLESGTALDAIQLSSRLSTLKKQKATTLEKLNLSQEKAAALKSRKLNAYSYQAKRVLPSYSSEKIEAIVSEITKSINNNNRAKRKKTFTEREKEILGNDTTVGYQTCSKCHPKQTEFWKTTEHATAFSTLENRGQSYNTDCLPCHVSPGTITSKSTESEKALLLSLAVERKTIGCVVCHSPVTEHIASPETSTPQRRPIEADCRRCHTFEMDDTFDYTRKIELVACPAE